MKLPRQLLFPRLGLIGMFLFILAIGGTLAFMRATDSSDSRIITVNQSVEVDQAQITLNRVELSQRETQITYSINRMGTRMIEPMSIPSIKTSSSNKLESEHGGGAVNINEQSWTHTVPYPKLPHGTTEISVELPSLISYKEATNEITLPLETATRGVDIAEITGVKKIPVGQVFSIGEAKYRLREFVIDGDTMGLILEPSNTTAEKTVLAGSLSSLTLLDSSRSEYEHFLNSVTWDAGLDKVIRQEVHFKGLANDGLGSLILKVDGLGTISPGPVFVVDVS